MAWPDWPWPQPDFTTDLRHCRYLSTIIIPFEILLSVCLSISFAHTHAHTANILITFIYVGYTQDIHLATFSFHICHDLFQFQQSRAHSSVCLHVRYIGIVHIIHTISNQCGIQSLEYIRYIISNIVNLHTEASILVNTGDLKMLSISVGFRGEMEVKHQWTDENATK